MEEEFDVVRKCIADSDQRGNQSRSFIDGWSVNIWAVPVMEYWLILIIYPLQRFDLFTMKSKSYTCGLPLLNNAIKLTPGAIFLKKLQLPKHSGGQRTNGT